MDALDVVSLAVAKEHLVVDFPDKDADITRNIKTAVALVEVVTNHMLYEREKSYSIPSSGYLEIYDYPFAVISSSSGLTTTHNVLSSAILAEAGSTVNANVGYASGDVPSNLIEAVLKIVTYLFENKDVYEANLPFDVQLLLNPMKRSATF